MKLADEIKNIDVSPKKLREFGLLVGGVFLALGGLMAWHQKPAAPYLFGVGGFLALFGAARPVILRSVYKGWMTLAALLGWFMSRVLLSILFYTTVTPIGLIIRARGKDLLDLKFPEASGSYWHKRTAVKPDECEKQF